CRDLVDPIALNDIDDSNEWIVGELDGEGEDAEDELVFDDDVLTWRDVVSATGAAEPLKYTRRQTQMQRTVTTSTSNKEKGKKVVEEEDNSGYPAIPVRGSTAPFRCLGLTTMSTCKECHTFEQQPKTKPYLLILKIGHRGSIEALQNLCLAPGTGGALLFVLSAEPPSEPRRGRGRRRLQWRRWLVDDDGHGLLRAEELVEHDPGTFDEGEEDAAEGGSAGGGGEALTHGEEATGGGAGDDGVPGILLLAGVDHGAVEGGEEAAPDGEAAADAGSVEADGVGGADETVALGGIVETLEEVEGGAAHRSHAKRASDVVQYAIRARFPRRLWSSHLDLGFPFSLVAFYGNDLPMHKFF
ncbi:hypothetical protein CR513_08514, partial [Mucuna pruriens]